MTVYLAVPEADFGTVTFDDQASVPAELGSDDELDVQAIDIFIDAVEGRATAYHKVRGGCIEEWDHEGRASRSWRVVWFAFPGWRRRWTKVAYEPYC